MRLNIHIKEPYLMLMSLLEQIDETCILKYIFQNKNSKLIMLFILLADFFYENTSKIVHQSIIIMQYTHLCPFNEHLKPCYGK